MQRPCTRQDHNVSKEKQRGQCSCSKWARERVPEIRKVTWEGPGGQILLDLYLINSLDENVSLHPSGTLVDQLISFHKDSWNRLPQKEFYVGNWLQKDERMEKPHIWVKHTRGKHIWGISELPQISHPSSLIPGQAVHGCPWGSSWLPHYLDELLPLTSKEWQEFSTRLLILPSSRREGKITSRNSSKLTQRAECSLNSPFLGTAPFFSSSPWQFGWG